jgi:uncharacterized protein (TIGR03067 family)
MKIHDKPTAVTKYIMVWSFSCFIAAGLTGCKSKEDELRDEDLAKLQGVWEFTGEDNQKFAIIVEEDTVILSPEDGKEVFKVQLFPLVKPKRFTISRPGGEKKKSEELSGIYDVANQGLKVGLSKDNVTPPASFTKENTFTFELKGKSSGLSPVDSNYIRGLKTWNYWQKVNKINSEGKSAANSPMKSVTTPEEAITALQAASDTLRNVHTGFTSLAVLGIDDEALGHTRQIADLLGKYELLCDASIEFLKELKQFQDYSVSDEAVRETIVRLMLGDPGKIAEMNQLGQQMNTRLSELNASWQALQEKEYSLDTQGIKVRDDLSQKYNREFPKLD